MKLITIPADKYSDYRYRVIFDAYKWDPQVGDSNTVARHAILMSRSTADMIAAWTERLAKETQELEEAMIGNLRLAKNLGLGRRILKVLDRLQSYDRKRHVRLMRFDFHPTESDLGWAISEVNSDVPGGLAEASVFPQIAAEYFDCPDHEPYISTASCIYKAFEQKLPQDATLAFVHCTSYSDDRQVMQFLADHFNERTVKTVLMAPDHIRWEGKKAVSVLSGWENRNIDGIVRFFPLEWMVNLPRSSNWHGYYESETPSCNHPVAILTQSKRLPLVWDEAGVDLTTWKTLLPETCCPKDKRVTGDGWIYKPALGRVGEGISIKGTMPEKKLARIRRAARWYKKDWVAQRVFNSRPLVTAEGEKFHLCVGAFAVDGKCAGFYGRVNTYARMDANAKDIPILVAKEGCDG